MRIDIKRITQNAMLTAAALILYVLESQFPALTAVPGIKIGLSNAVTLLAVSLCGRRNAGAVLLTRIVLGSIFTGNMTSFIYSACGGICCYLVICALYPIFKDRQLWAVSVFGAAAHNCGQLLAACVMLSSVRVLWYFPALLLSAVISGVFTGLCAQYTAVRIKKAQKNNS